MAFKSIVRKLFHWETSSVTYLWDAHEYIENNLDYVAVLLNITEKKYFLMQSSVTMTSRSLCLFSIIGMSAGESSSTHGEHSNQVYDILM